MFTIQLYESDQPLRGYCGLASQRTAEKWLPELEAHARRDATTTGRDLDAYEVVVIEHGDDCNELGCPGVLGLNQQCREAANHRIEPTQ